MKPIDKIMELILKDVDPDLRVMVETIGVDSISPNLVSLLQYIRDLDRFKKGVEKLKKQLKETEYNLQELKEMAS